MKSRLFYLLILLLCVITWRQARAQDKPKPDTIPPLFIKNILDTSWYCCDPNFTPGSNFIKTDIIPRGWLQFKKEKETDTLRIIYIGFDTAYEKYSGANRLRKADGGIVQFDSDTHRIPWMVWQFGYLVTAFGREYHFLTHKKKPVGPPFYIWDYRVIDIGKPILR